MGVTKRRKRLRVLSQTSEDDTPEEVGEFEEKSSDGSDFASPNGRLSQQVQPKVAAIRIGTGESRNQASSWVERYADVAAQSGLATSARKRKEIQTWLQAALGGSCSRMLVLAGPPGCGKSSTVHAVAKEMQCQVIEWQAPPATSRGVSYFLLEDFRSFLVGGRYPTLCVDLDDEMGGEADQRSKVILVQDFPISANDMLQYRTTLQQTFSEVGRFSPHPVIVILSDSDKEIARAARLILGPDLLQSPNVTMIKVPAITDAMMKRRLHQVLAMESLSLSENKLAQIVCAGRGDIRAALNVLQFCTTSFSCGNANANGHWRQSRRRNSKRLKPSTSTRLPDSGVLGQDPTLGMYHAVSKVLNNKRKEDGSSKYVAEDILEDARADPSSFLSFLHHNYPDFFGDIDDAVEALDCLSNADSLLRWKQDDLVRNGLGDCAASLATRGFLLHNGHPVQEGWRPIRGPESYEVARESKERVAEAREKYAKGMSPCVFTRSTMSETVPFAQVVLQSMAHPFGNRKHRLTKTYIPMVDTAEMAMADTEASQGESAAKIAITTNDGTFDLPEQQDNMEEIEDWDDDDND